jgi:Flp pilus assembly protein TadG
MRATQVKWMREPKGALGKTRGRRCFLRSQCGASAVEFAIVVPVFLALMFSTFEVGWFYFVNASVDAATVNVARLLRTGQAQKQGYEAQADRDDFFANEVCPKLKFLADCESRLTVEVQTFESFEKLAADKSPVTCRDDQPDAIQNLEFEPGSDNAVVRVRICLIYDTLNPAIGLNLAKNDAGQRRVAATYVLRVEPYSKNKKTSTVKPS